MSHVYILILICCPILEHTQQNEINAKPHLFFNFATGHIAKHRVFLFSKISTVSHLNRICELMDKRVSTKCICECIPRIEIYFANECSRRRKITIGYRGGLAKHRRFVCRFMIGQYVTVHGDVISHVNISAVRVEDGGEYRCSAVNRVSRAHHAARLNIYGLPHVRAMGNYAAVAGETTVIKCPVAGFPIASITWEKGSPSCQSIIFNRPMLFSDRIISHLNFYFTRTPFIFHIEEF